MKRNYIDFFNNTKDNVNFIFFLYFLFKLKNLRENKKDGH